jgi:hypothetical protein
VVTQIFIRHLFDVLHGDPLADAIGINYAAFWNAIPVLTSLTSIWMVILFWIGFAVVISACMKYLKTLFGPVALLLLVLALVLSRDADGGQTLPQLVNFLLAAFVIVRRIRFHLPFYVWYAFLSTAIPYLPWLFAGHPFFQLQGFWMAALLSLAISTLFRPIPSPLHEGRPA